MQSEFLAQDNNITQTGIQVTQTNVAAYYTLNHYFISTNKLLISKSCYSFSHQLIPENSLTNYLKHFIITVHGS